MTSGQLCPLVLAYVAAVEALEAAVVAAGVQRDEGSADLNHTAHTVMIAAEGHLDALGRRLDGQREQLSRSEDLVLVLYGQRRHEAQERSAALREWAHRQRLVSPQPLRPGGAS